MEHTFYIVRHAQSLGNAGVPKAGPNPGLSDLGRRQASALAEHVSSQAQVAEIWSSPFERAVETACAVAQAAGLRVRLEPAMHELFFPGWFDLETLRMPSLAEIAAAHSLVDTDQDDEHWWPREPEDETALHRRLAGLAERVRRDGKPGTTVLVGHGASVAALTQALVPSYCALIAQVQNASVTEIHERDGTCDVIRFNDTSFQL